MGIRRGPREVDVTAKSGLRREEMGGAAESLATVIAVDRDDDQRLVVLEIGFDHRPQAAPAAEEHGDVPGPRGFLDVAHPHRMRRTCFLAALATDDDEIGFRRLRRSEASRAGKGWVQTGECRWVAFN